ncbi:MAG: ankyrin repeat domain-containing protein [Chroococcales cyanobacterium]
MELQTLKTMIVKMLTEAGADVNAKTNFGLMPLMTEAGNGLVPVVQFLSDCGAHIRPKDNNNWTVLLWASEEKLKTWWNCSNKPDMSDRPARVGVEGQEWVRSPCKECGITHLTGSFIRIVEHIN